MATAATIAFTNGIEACQGKYGGESGIRTRGTPLKGVQSLSRRSLSATQPSLRDLFYDHLSTRDGRSVLLAEGAGFEPANLSVNGFQDRRHRPLGHPSVRYAFMLPRGGNSVNPSHVGPERLGDDDAPVRLLVVLQDRDEGSSHGEARTVKGVPAIHLSDFVAPGVA